MNWNGESIIHEILYRHSGICISYKTFLIHVQISQLAIMHDAIIHWNSAKEYYQSFESLMLIALRDSFLDTNLGSGLNNTYILVRRSFRRFLFPCIYAQDQNQGTQSNINYLLWFLSGRNLLQWHKLYRRPPAHKSFFCNVIHKAYTTPSWASFKYHFAWTNNVTGH